MRDSGEIYSQHTSNKFNEELEKLRALERIGDHAFKQATFGWLYCFKCVLTSYYPFTDKYLSHL